MKCNLCETDVMNTDGEGLCFSCVLRFRIQDHPLNALKLPPLHTLDSLRACGGNLFVKKEDFDKLCEALRDVLGHSNCYCKSCMKIAEKYYYPKPEKEAT